MAGRKVKNMSGNPARGQADAYCARANSLEGLVGRMRMWSACAVALLGVAGLPAMSASAADPAPTSVPIELVELRMTPQGPEVSKIEAPNAAAEANLEAQDAADPNLIIERPVERTVQRFKAAPGDFIPPNATQIGAPLPDLDGSGTKIALLDVGIEATHPDVVGHVVMAPAPFLSVALDDHSHATAVGSVIETIAPNATLYSAQVCDAFNCPIDAIAEGVKWAVSQGVQVINLSLGGTAPSEVEHAIIDWAVQQGVVVVVAAGNEGANGNPLVYPAAYASAISVGAVDSSGNRASFSSFGPWMDLVAPGDSLRVAVDVGHDTWSGTSFSAPHVAAVAAMLKKSKPGLTPAQVQAALQASGKSTGGLAAPLVQASTAKLPITGDLTSAVTSSQAHQVSLTWPAIVNAALAEIHVNNIVTTTFDLTHPYSIALPVDGEQYGVQVLLRNAQNQIIWGSTPMLFTPGQAQLSAPSLSLLTQNTIGVTVNFVASPGATEYRLYRSGTTGPVGGFTTTGTGAQSVGVTLDSNVAGTYTLTALNNNGNESAPSNSQVLAAPSNTLVTPTGLRVDTLTLNTNTGKANGTIRWNQVTGAGSYVVVSNFDLGGGASVLQVPQSANPSVNANFTIGGFYTFYVIAQTGPISPPGAPFTFGSFASPLFRFSPEPSMAPPTIAIGTSNGDARVSWNNVLGAGDYYIYRDGEPYDATNVASEFTPTTTAFVDTGAATAHHYFVRSAFFANVPGFIVLSGPSNTVSISGGDSAAPLITNVLASAPSTQATVTWTTNEASSSVVAFGLTSALVFNASTNGNVTSHSVLISGLQCQTTYRYRVNSTDGANNQAISPAVPTTLSFTTGQCPADVTNVVITDGITVIADKTSATLGWTTNKPANLQTQLQPSGGTQVGPIGAINHLYTFTGLTCGTTYNAMITGVATSGAGNLLPTIRNFATAACASGGGGGGGSGGGGGGNSTTPTTPSPTPTPLPEPEVAGKTVSNPGYRIVTFNGHVYNYGAAQDFGSANTYGVVDLASTTNGYWLVTFTGKILPFGDAKNLGDLSTTNLTNPVVAMAATPTGKGYWLTTANGAVYPYGDAQQKGGMGNTRLNAAIIAMTPTPTGNGYWLLASDGGIFSFGDAAFWGSTGDKHLNAPIVAMAPTATNRGYWLVGADGAIFSFGDAKFFGAASTLHLNKPINGIAATPTGNGYWLVASDGGIFSYGDAAFLGSAGNERNLPPIVAFSPA
jgi:subtilisin family serine protease